MLTGQRPFEGEDVSDTLATVLKSEPDWTALPADVPAHIRVLIQRCLAKDRRQRMADMSVALFVMAEAASLAPAAGCGGTDRDAGASATVAPPRRCRLLRRSWLVPRSARPSGSRCVRPRLASRGLRISPTGAAALSVDSQSRDLTITPDGTHIVYKGSRNDRHATLRPRTGSARADAARWTRAAPRAPFSSPDGQWIGFVEPVPVTLKKVAITGGPALTLCRLDSRKPGRHLG